MNPQKTPQKTLVAAAVLFALAACQPQPDAFANTAGEDDPLLVQEDDDRHEHDDDDHDDHDEDHDDGEDNDEDDADDTDAVASSPANVTEHADEAADDALLDTREGGNPLVNSPVAPVDPIAQDDEDDDDE